MAEDDHYENNEPLMPPELDEYNNMGSTYGHESSEESSGRDEDQDDGQCRSGSISVETLVESALQDIKDGKLDLTNSDEFATFKSKDGDSMAMHTGQPREPTVLHLILTHLSAEKKKSHHHQSLAENESFKRMIMFLVRHPRNLLCVKDQTGDTPLTRAVVDKQERLIENMCDEAGNCVSASLEVVNINGENCIHLAIQKRLPIAKRLIELSSDGKALAAKDKDGNPPLHFAVQYKACRKGQLSVVRELIQRGDSAMKRNGDLNDKGHSPYFQS